MATVACFSNIMINRMQSSDKEVTGIILAGGKSRRMGQDKGLIPYQGKSMVSYSIDLLSLFCNRILISTSNPAYKEFGIETVPDLHAELGPMGGLFSCLKVSETTLNICLPCDIPEMKPSVLQYLLQVSDGSSCIVPCTPLPEPLVSVYPATVLPVIGQLMNEGRYKMTDIFKHFPVKFIPMHEFQEENVKKLFSNINSPVDLK